MDYLPEGSVLIDFLNEVRADLYALCLFDSGSTNTLINHRAVPPGIPIKLGTPQSFTTTQGTYESSKIFQARNIFFPNFCKSRSIPEVQLRLFNSPKSRYDVIISRDVLKSGFVLDHVWNTVAWDGLTISMTLATNTPPFVTSSFSCAHTASAVYTNTVILQAKNEKFSPQDVVNKCKNLAIPQQEKIL